MQCWIQDYLDERRQTSRGRQLNINCPQNTHANEEIRLRERGAHPPKSASLPCEQDSKGTVPILVKFDVQQIFNIQISLLVNVCHCYYRPQRSWAKVMFLQVCVILFTGVVCPGRYTPPGQVHPGQVHSPASRYTPRAGTPPRQVHPPWAGTPPTRKQTPAYGQRAASTHLTGMHSCSNYIFKVISDGFSVT